MMEDHVIAALERCKSSKHRFIIFLDVDGVLNSEVYYTYRNVTSKRQRKKRWNAWDPFAIKLLNDITDSTGAMIVLSSSWRLGRTPNEIIDMLASAGVTGRVIGATEQINSSFNRGKEIHEWIQANQEFLGQSYDMYRTYAILDDDSDMLYVQRGNFFHCDAYGGLTPNIAYKIKRFFASFVEPAPTVDLPVNGFMRRSTGDQTKLPENAQIIGNR